MTEEEKKNQSPKDEAPSAGEEAKAEAPKEAVKEESAAEKAEETAAPPEEDVEQAPAKEEKEPEPEAIEQAIEEAKTEGKIEEISLPDIRPGMLVRVHHKIKERTAKGEDKERIQVFEGLVIAVRGGGNQKTFTVRKVSGGVGVEKIFPIAAPTIDHVEVVKQYRVRRAKLWFLKRGWKKRLKEVKPS